MKKGDSVKVTTPWGKFNGKVTNVELVNNEEFLDFEVTHRDGVCQSFTNVAKLPEDEININYGKVYWFVDKPTIEPKAKSKKPKSLKEKLNPLSRNTTDVV